MKVLFVSVCLLLCIFQCQAINLRSFIAETLSGRTVAELHQLQLATDSRLFHVGCYDEPSSVEQVLRSLDAGEPIEQCSLTCDTPFFAIAPDQENVCICLPRAASALTSGGNTLRRNFGECGLAFDDTTGLVDVYFQPIDNPATDATCSSRTLGIRSKMTGEGNAPGGFDIILGEERPTIFAPYANGCGTNMWNVQSGSVGTISELRSETTRARDFAIERRREFSSAVETQVSAGVPLGPSFGGSVSASVDINSGLSRQGTDISESKMIESSAQLFIAQVVIPRSRKHYVTLQGSGSSGFLGRVVDYFTAGLTEQLGLRIIRDFGQFGVTQASYGGYFQRRSVYTSRFQSSTTMSDREIETCFGASVEASGVVQGVELGGGVASQTCTASAQNSLFSASEDIREATDTTSFVGGDVIGGEFKVSADSSRLLIKPELYPDDADKPRLQLLADFLHRDLISPITCGRARLSEDQFHEVHLALRELSIRLFDRVQEVLDSCGCNDEGVAVIDRYVIRDSLANSDIECKCIQPVLQGELEDLCTRNDGVLSDDKRVCCPATCGTCGGTDCQNRPGGAGDCCQLNVLRDEQTCEFSQPPCRLDEITQPELCRARQGILSPDGTVCCQDRCRSCGGNNCNKRPGGENNCCQRKVANRGLPCQFHASPCVMGELV